MASLSCIWIALRPSQKPRSVIQALVDYYEGYNANVHRGVHALSMEATDRYEEARQKVARFIKADTEESIIWTRNTTEGVNPGGKHVGPGPYQGRRRDRRHSDGAPQQPGALAEGGKGEGRNAPVPAVGPGRFSRSRRRRLRNHAPHEACRHSARIQLPRHR